MNNKKQQTEITEDKNNTAGTEPDNNEHTALSPESIKTLEDAIKNMHAEIDFASHSFSANADNAAKNLNSTVNSLNESLKSSNHNLGKYDKISKTLDSQTSTLSLLPKKVADCLKASIDSNIPQITKELLDSQTKQNELIQKSFEKSIESFEAKSGEIISKFNNELAHYQNELVQITELSAKRRIQRLLTTLIIAGVFSALVSSITGYYINSKFPHSVELHDNGSVTVQNSQVLVVDPKSPHNKGK